LALNVLPDSESSIEWAEFVQEIEANVVYNTQALFSPWYVWWVPSLKSQNITCVISDGFKTDDMLAQAKQVAPSNPLYVLSTDPSRPTPHHLYNLNNQGLQVIHGYDTAWTGHRLMYGHSALAHLQMEVCASSQYVMFNSYGPQWLLDGVIAMRAAMQDSVVTTY